MNNILIWGIHPSNENGIDRDAFIEEQKRIIREQNEQIQGYETSPKIV